MYAWIEISNRDINFTTYHSITTVGGDAKNLILDIALSKQI